MTKPLGKWKLPQPTDLKENSKWVSIPRVARTIPFGYELDPKDKGILLPISAERIRQSRDLASLKKVWHMIWSSPMG